MIKISHTEVSPFLTNCYLIKDEATGEAALVDPGDDADHLVRFINDADVKVKYILATHCHVDHISATSAMMKHLDLGFMACEKDQFLIDGLADTCRMYGLQAAEPPVITKKIVNGDTLPLGESTLKFHHAPGHSPGSMLIQAGEKDLVVGDVLFAGSIGRTDLPGGSMETLRDSIMNVLVPLGDDIRVYPGHGPATTIGWERQNNMFILEWSS